MANCSVRAGLSVLAFDATGRAVVAEVEPRNGGVAAVNTGAEAVVDDQRATSAALLAATSSASSAPTTALAAAAAATRSADDSLRFGPAARVPVGDVLPGSDLLALARAAAIREGLLSPDAGDADAAAATTTTDASASAPSPGASSAEPELRLVTVLEVDDPAAVGFAPDALSSAATLPPRLFHYIFALVGGIDVAAANERRSKQTAAAATAAAKRSSSSSSSSKAPLAKGVSSDDELPEMGADGTACGRCVRLVAVDCADLDAAVSGTRVSSSSSSSSSPSSASASSSSSSPGGRLQLGPGAGAGVVVVDASLRPVDAWLDQAVRMFRPLREEVERASKRTVRAWPAGTSVFPHDAADLSLFHLLDPVTYMFDHPGKGVRSAAIRVLSEEFSIADGDVQALMHTVDRFHEASLVIDDIEDDSDLRRDADASHIRFGVPASINAGYLCVFAMLDSVPRLFRGHHDATQRLLVTGFVEAHRGQGADIHWRDHRYVPTIREYVEMIRGKTSTPFVSAATLFFLHANDWRLRALRLRDFLLRIPFLLVWHLLGRWVLPGWDARLAVNHILAFAVWLLVGWWWPWGSSPRLSSTTPTATPTPSPPASPRVSAKQQQQHGAAAGFQSQDDEADLDRLAPLWSLEGAMGSKLSSEEQLIVRLYDRLGIFFQIRDDYINLTDKEYWATKGFCDDLHERKYSYPVILMVRGRLGRWRDLLAMYESPDELTRADLERALAWVTESGALEQTRRHLLRIQAQVRADAATAGLAVGLRPILAKLHVE